VSNILRGLVLVVGIVTTLWVQRSGVLIPAGARDFFPLRNGPDRLWGPPNLLFNGYGGSLRGVRHSATNRNLVGSIPDGVIEIFH
jgi:hypothetical protein